MLQGCDINSHLKHSISNCFKDDQIKSNEDEDIEIEMKKAEEDATIAAQYFKRNEFESKVTNILVNLDAKQEKW